MQFLTIINTPTVEILYVFGLDAVQNTKKSPKNVNELTDPPERRKFLAFLETVYLFRVDAVQKP